MGFRSTILAIAHFVVIRRIFGWVFKQTTFKMLPRKAGCTMLIAAKSTVGMDMSTTTKTLITGQTLEGGVVRLVGERATRSGGLQ